MTRFGSQADTAGHIPAVHTRQGKAPACQEAGSDALTAVDPMPAALAQPNSLSLTLKEESGVVQALPLRHVSEVGCCGPAHLLTC